MIELSNSHICRTVFGENIWRCREVIEAVHANLLQHDTTDVLYNHKLKVCLRIREKENNEQHTFLEYSCVHTQEDDVKQT